MDKASEVKHVMKRIGEGQELIGHSKEDGGTVLVFVGQRRKEDGDFVYYVKRRRDEQVFESRLQAAARFVAMAAHYWSDDHEGIELDDLVLIEKVTARWPLL